MEVEVVAEGLDGGDGFGGVSVVHVVIEQHERDVRNVSFSSLDTQLGQLKRRLPLGKPHSRSPTNSPPSLAKLLKENLRQNLVTLALKTNSENNSQSFLSGDKMDLLVSAVIDNNGVLGRLALDGFEALGEGGTEQVAFHHSESHGQIVCGGEEEGEGGGGGRGGGGGGGEERWRRGGGENEEGEEGM